MGISAANMVRIRPVGFKEEELSQDEKARAHGDRSQAPGMCQGLCWAPKHRHLRTLGAAGEADVTTCMELSCTNGGKCCGDAGLSVWLAVLAGRLGACTVQEDRQAETTGTAGVSFVNRSSRFLK